MDREKVLHLAKLARIDVSETEAENLSHEFESILGYVGEVKEASKETSAQDRGFLVKNVLREDAEPHESGIYTEKLLEQAPQREGDYIKVKKIL